MNDAAVVPTAQASVPGTRLISPPDSVGAPAIGAVRCWLRRRGQLPRDAAATAAATFTVSIVVTPRLAATAAFFFAPLASPGIASSPADACPRSSLVTAVALFGDARATTTARRAGTLIPTPSQDDRPTPARALADLDVGVGVAPLGGDAEDDASRAPAACSHPYRRAAVTVTRAARLALVRRTDAPTDPPSGARDDAGRSLSRGEKPRPTTFKGQRTPSRGRSDEL
eukprot:CAMPEP_0181362608 /NCGR_PEP_ID=MMETSP1106-20121128/8138_1 /TAXON_ID=81844 /ORGANISM="Mantoniella antarctica, Strain SL-175" /LENGTH=226 /DNA_ID=CAMNT_0023476655 /DNA_START=80 /DNA_END=762 /DNA_ORIENTATION=-